VRKKFSRLAFSITQSTVLLILLYINFWIKIYLRTLFIANSITKHTFFNCANFMFRPIYGTISVYQDRGANARTHIHIFSSLNYRVVRLHYLQHTTALFCKFHYYRVLEGELL
jgi:hypothetical protein